MAVPEELQFPGKEQEFKLKFVMPMLARMGFAPIDTHGPREFGRDVVFAEVDRFGHTVFHGAQVKFEKSISQSSSHELVRDAREAFSHPFVHPQTNQKHFISSFYVFNAGSFSEQATANVFAMLERDGIRSVRLYGGQQLVLLNRFATAEFSNDLQRRLSGLVYQVRWNNSILPDCLTHVNGQLAGAGGQFASRFRVAASESFLASPPAIDKLNIRLLELYNEHCLMLNRILDGPPGIQTVDDVANYASAFLSLKDRFLALGQELEIQATLILRDLNVTLVSWAYVSGAASTQPKG